MKVNIRNLLASANQKVMKLKKLRKELAKCVPKLDKGEVKVLTAGLINSMVDSKEVEITDVDEVRLLPLKKANKKDKKDDFLPFQDTIAALLASAAADDNKSMTPRELRKQLSKKVTGLDKGEIKIFTAGLVNKMVDEGGVEVSEDDIIRLILTSHDSANGSTAEKKEEKQKKEKKKKQKKEKKQKKKM